MTEHSDLADEATRRILDRLSAIERNQRLANSRIRQDLAGLTGGVAMTAVILILIWRDEPWTWWYALALALIVPTLIGWLVGRVQDQEEP